MLGGIGLSDILQLASHAPAATRIFAALQRAANGDPDAIEYIKREGWIEALELVRPGAGTQAQEVLRQITTAASNINGTLGGHIIEGEFREVSASAPWVPFMRRMLRQQSSGEIILGPTGSGKTQLAVKLAYRYAQENGYRVEACNLYANDKPPFAVTISTDTLVNRMAQLRQYLKGLEVLDYDDGLEDDGYDDYEEAIEVAVPARMPAQRRIIIIDESVLAMSSSYHDPARQAALKALMQSRHLSWRVLYIGQLAHQIPLPLLGQSIVWIKQPAGRESQTDRNHPVVRDLWDRAQRAFEGLTRWEWYQDPWRDVRCWSYVDAQSINGERGYSGLVPFLPYEDDNDLVEVDGGY